MGKVTNNTIAGSVLCFCGDMLLGCFYPMEKVGIFHLFPAFSEEWSNATSIRFIIGGLLGVIALLLMFCGFYAISVLLKEKGLVDKLKKNGFLYGILIIPIAGGHFYDGKTKRTNPDGNP